MSFNRARASTTRSTSASAMTMRPVRLGARTTSTSASGSELEIDEFMRLDRREEDEHEDEVGVRQGLSRPGAMEDQVEALLALGERLEQEERRHVERDQAEHRHRDHRRMEVCRDPRRHVQGRREAARAEEDEPDANQVEGEHDAQHAAYGVALDVVLHTERPVEAQKKAVVEAPEDERPVGAVPEAPEGHSGEDVPILHAPPTAVAAEGDVEIVAQPGGEADVAGGPGVPG